ncbi:MAG: 4-hydroxy-tetrahydrodipicolinate reductase [Flavobacteriales bacterium]|nr:4-hydroxy-tetrahydrodipicolinate reductase [Flavobacteriales bacterium]
MNIALYGYGKMGKAIEEVALSRGHRIILRVDHRNAGSAPEGADVAIEFSKPDVALANMRLCLQHKVPVVVGTTGWYDHLNEIKSLVQSEQGSLLWASNFSIGVNLFFKLNKYLAGLMDGQPAYQVAITETHHIHKLDAPSGTAITLARDIDLRSAKYSGWKLHEQQPKDVAAKTTGTDTMPVAIHSERIGEVPGTHAVTWKSPEDRLSITHEAFGRHGFALGAVVAAEWIPGRTGLFTMDDLLDGN